MSLVIVGSIGLDDVKTPSGSVKNAIGGSTMYAAMASRFFEKPSVVGVVGEDFPQEYVELLNSEGIDTEGLEQVAGKTFYWSGEYNDLNRAESLDTQLNVFEFFDPKLPKSYCELPYALLGNIDPELQMKVFDQLTAPKVVAMDTMNFWIDIKKEKLLEIVNKVDILFINEDELKMLTGEENVFKAANTGLSYGPELLVIKRGEYGAMAIKKDFLFFTPIIPLETVVDPTGAGDSFAGGFMGYLASKNDFSEETVRQAMIYGTVMASINIEDFSIQCLRKANKETIENRKEQIRKSVIF